MDVMKDEISIMSQMSHDHIIRHIESYEDDKYVFMIMEALTDACELEDVISQRLREVKFKKATETPLFNE